MELFTTIAFTVGLVVLVAAWVTAVLMIKTDTFTNSRPTKSAPVAPPVSVDAPRVLVNS